MPPTLPATTARQLRLVTFDITGTLLRFRHPPAEQYSVTGAQFGVHAKPSELASGFKQQWKHQCAQHPNFGASTGLPWRSWWVELVRGTFISSPSLTFEDKAEGCDPSRRDTKLTSLADHLIETYSTPEGWCIVNGATKLLESLRQDGLTLGVVSNFDSRLERLLSSMGIRDFFSFVIASYEVGVTKPDVRIFQEALKRASRIVGPLSPHEACHIGDTPSSDYLGARQAGWHAVIVNSCPEDVTSQCKGVDPSHIVSSLMEVKFYILKERQVKSLEQ